MADRRSFLAGMLAAGLFPKPTWAEVGSPAFLSAGRKPDGTYVLCGLSDTGQIAFQLPLPDRGHAAAAHPRLAEAVAFARRPGKFALVINCVTGREIARLEAAADRHFYGHGVFSRDGELLFTTENEFETARGVVGIWDGKNGYDRVGEFSSGGIGPHDIKLMPDGETLVIANGGIETHPASGRTKLNIPTMRPSLSYLKQNGELLDAIELDAALHKNSIRHLAVARDGTVAFAMQWQGDQVVYPPVLGLHRSGSVPELVGSDAIIAERMFGYAGSVAVSDRANTAVVTSPRGGVLQVFDVRSGQFDRQLEIEDVCGVAKFDNAFCVTNGLGQICSLEARGYRMQAEHLIQWDNHLVPVGA